MQEYSDLAKDATSFSQKLEAALKGCRYGSLLEAALIDKMQLTVLQAAKVVQESGLQQSSANLDREKVRR